MASASDPHADQRVAAAGPHPSQAAAVLILLHGRGDTAEGILQLYDALQFDRVAALAPQATSNTWYPHSFLAPLDANQPYLESALRRIAAIVDDLISTDTPSERIALLGFSQGACLACEFAARNPQKYGAIMALTGGLIGPPGTERNYAGSLAGTPVFLGTSDPDMHVPFARVEETSDVFKNMGANVELRRYPGMPHTVNEDELSVCRTLLQTMVDSQGQD